MQRWEDPPIFSCRPESPQCRRGRYLWSRFRDRPRCLPGLLVLPAVQVRDAHLLPRSQTGAHAPSDAGQLPPAVMLMTGFPMVFKISTPPIRKRDTCGMIIVTQAVWSLLYESVHRPSSHYRHLYPSRRSLHPTLDSVVCLSCIGKAVVARKPT